MISQETYNPVSCIQQQLEYRAGEREDSIGMILLKPDHVPADEDFVRDALATSGLEVVGALKANLSVAAASVLYFTALRYEEADLVFGIEWKSELLRHLTSGQSNLYIVSGIQAVRSCLDIKGELRRARGKIGKPDEILSPQDFLDLAVRNVVHSVDEHDIEQTLWLTTDATSFQSRMS